MKLTALTVLKKKMLVIFRKIFLILIILSFKNLAWAEEGSCEYKFDNDQITLKSIDIDVNKYRKWQINNTKILTDNTYFIPNEFKKRFLSKITFFYSDKSSCTFNAKIRTHGNFKDHIKYKNGNLVQSLDVRLINGNVKNITKFKLFLKNTRGNFEDEIFMTELLRSLGYIAPRTQLVEVNLNNQNLQMIFQEKVTKELLEYHNRREGPILEGDEKYMMDFASKIENNPGIDWPEIHRKFKLGKKIQLAKQTNSSWAIKNEKFKSTSFNSLDRLNKIYLAYLYNFSFDDQIYSILNYNMNNYLLAQKSKEKELKLNIFNNLILAANGHHMLYGNNRKFYWDSFENFFDPIYYDGNLIIDKKFEKLSPPFSSDYDISIDETKVLLKKIDKTKLYEDIKSTNIRINKKRVNAKIEKLNDNLNIIKEKFKEQKIEKTFNRNVPTKELLEKTYLTNLEDQKLDINFIKINDNLNSKKLFFSCKKNDLKCDKKIILNETELRDLLEGNLRKNSLNYQFYDYKKKDFPSFKFIELNDENFENVKFYYNSHTSYKYDFSNRKFKIDQTDELGRSYFVGGKIKNILIEFNGINNNISKRELNRYDETTLTGCLSIIRSELNNLSLKSINSNCEDGINIISSNGNIKELISINSYFDGIDFDFSKLNVEDIKVSNAGNDCIDFSFGNYFIKNSNLTKCSDKAISVGEKSKSRFINTEISFSNTGSASKDSSISKFKNLSIANVSKCLSSYKKKQEYGGGYLKVENLDCKNFKNKIFVDKYSNIEVLNEL